MVNAAASEGSKDVLLQSLSTTVPPHFQQAQQTLANHRKNIVSLYRIHLACSKISEQTSKGMRLVGEKQFNDIFLGCLNRVLSFKRGITNADRVIKFASSYCSYAQEQFRADARKALQNHTLRDDEEEEEEEEEDTAATRFVTILLRHLLGGFNAKDKNVRHRCCQTIALLVSGLESVDDALYEKLKANLMIRASDKESSVRVQAIIALQKLQSGEEEEEEVETTIMAENERGITITEIMKQLLRHDPSAEVRRAAMFNLPLNQSTLPDILERLCDVDTMTRRCLYLGTLSNKNLEGPHCQAKFGKEHWSSIVKIGLGEREASVVRAMKKLISSWVNVDGGRDEVERFLSRFDVVSSPESASMALEAAFEVRPPLLDTISFDNEFWEDLNPEKAFTARVFAKHCKALGPAGERRMEDTMPLVTALAFRTQAAWGKYIEQMEIQIAKEEDDDLKAIQANQSIVQSLLHVSINLDYGDEIGRRKMFGLIRELVSSPLLPEDLIGDCLDVLRKLSAGQKDFIRIIVEIAQEIEDVIEPEEADQSSESDDEAQIEGQLLGQPAVKEVTMSIEEKAQQAVIDARRLLIVRGMLERIVGGMQENTAMHGLVSQLIAPAVKSKEAIVREQGLICLGLCCLLDPNLAQNTFHLFLQQMEETDEAVRLASIRVIFDNLTSHGINFLCQNQIMQKGGDKEAADVIHSEMVTFLLGLLEDENQEIQAVAAEGMAKLMLTGIIEDDDALRSLILVYMSPETSTNQQLRQCLSYFLPVYCYSSSICQRRLQRVLVATLDVLIEVYHEQDGNQDMVTPLQVGMQLLDWTDPYRALSINKDVKIHIDVALELIQSLFTKEDKEDRKVICQLLGKLNLPEEKELQLIFIKNSPEMGSEDASTSTSDDDFLIIAVLFTLIGTVKNVHSIEKWDAQSRNNLNKFQMGCKVRYLQSWERIRALDPMTATELNGLRIFLEDCGLDVNKVIDVGDDGSAILVKQQRKPTSSRSGTASRITSAGTSRKASVGSVASVESSSKGVAGKGTTSRAARRSIVPIVIDSEEEEGGDDDLNASGANTSNIKIEEDDEDDFDTI